MSSTLSGSAEDLDSGPRGRSRPARRGRHRLDSLQAERVHPDGRRRVDLGHALPPRRRPACRRLARARLPARTRPEQGGDQRARRDVRLRRAELRRPDLRCARARSVRRARLDRRPARDRRHTGGSRLARVEARRRRREDRRLGRLVRRRRRLQLAGRRSALGCGGHGPDVDRPLHRNDAAGAREVGARRRVWRARSPRRSAIPPSRR